MIFVHRFVLSALLCDNFDNFCQFNHIFDHREFTAWEIICSTKSNIPNTSSAPLAGANRIHVYFHPVGQFQIPYAKQLLVNILELISPVPHDSIQVVIHLWQISVQFFIVIYVKSCPFIIEDKITPANKSDMPANFFDLPIGSRRLKRNENRKQIIQTSLSKSSRVAL